MKIVGPRERIFLWSISMANVSYSVVIEVGRLVNLLETTMY